MSRNAVLVLAMLWQMMCGRARANEMIYEQMLAGTAWIVAPNGDAGSGVLVDADRELVATSFHVVGMQNEVTVVFPAAGDQAILVEKSHYRRNLDKLGVKGQVTVRDPIRDLALIQLEKIPVGAKVMELAAIGAAPGQTVHSIGNPGASDALWVYSTGSVRQVYSKRFVTSGRIIESRIVETQTPINPGDSGGPVVNDAGQLVALTCAYRPTENGGFWVGGDGQIHGGVADSDGNLTLNDHGGGSARRRRSTSVPTRRVLLREERSPAAGSPTVGGVSAIWRQAAVRGCSVERLTESDDATA